MDLEERVGILRHDLWLGTINAESDSVPFDYNYFAEMKVM